MLIDPYEVNLNAFPTKLIRIYLSLLESECNIHFFDGTLLFISSFKFLSVA